MASPDQPTAPYLAAVIAYGFRGSTRFHVPGHKAGNGADLGVRTAIGWQTLKLDIPQDIWGVDLGPSPSRSSAPSSSPPRPTAPRAPGSSPTAPRRATTRSASRSPRSARR